jgi:prepilin-type N-terminal cleavage/methylation domain-containing protein
MIQKLRSNQKGFTLIELMIVIAIIGILAAIAIPQFAAYRLRSYNSSGQSDVRNYSTSQAAFFADWQIYGKSNDAGADASLVITGPSVAGTHQIVGTDAAAVIRALDIPIGRGVDVYGETDAGAGTFSGITKHVQGDTVYGVDGDTTAVYMCPDELCRQVSQQLIAGTLPVSPPTTADNFNGQANWVAK